MAGGPVGIDGFFGEVVGAASSDAENAPAVPKGRGYKYKAHGRRTIEVLRGRASKDDDCTRWI